MKYSISIGAIGLFCFLLCLSCTNTNQAENSTTSDLKKNKETSTKKSTPTKSTKTILFFGNSLTAGYGLDQDQSFPSLIQEKLNSASLEYTVVNAGLSGETTAGGLGRIDWMLKNKVDIFVLELGANDGLRGIKTTATKKNLQGIIDKVKAKYPNCDIIIAGMEAPPNMGEKFTSDFRTLFKDLAKSNNISLIPFLLKDVAGEENLNLPDGIHPNVEGQKIVATNVWETLKELL